MKLNYWSIIVVVFSIVSACAPAQQQQTTPEEVSPQVTIPPAVTITELPCAQIENNEAIVIFYAQKSLYENGAIFPGEQGLSCLNTLAGWLKSSTVKSWQIHVGGEGGYGFDPERLAMKRLELLRRYFQRQGLEAAGWTWQTSAEQGLQLQLTGSP